MTSYVYFQARASGSAGSNGGADGAGRATDGAPGNGLKGGFRAEGDVYRLPQGLRSEFQKPFGPVVGTAELPKHIRNGDVVIAVGDMVSRSAIELGLKPKIIVVDFATERHPIDAGLKRYLSAYGDRMVRVQNAPAVVTDELYAALLEAFRSPGTTRVEVEGEEDLAGLPLFAETPIGTVILYGMPGQGIVFVRNSEPMRRKARELLAKMRVG